MTREEAARLKKGDTIFLPRMSWGYPSTWSVTQKKVLSASAKQVRIERWGTSYDIHDPNKMGEWSLSPEGAVTNKLAMLASAAAVYRERAALHHRVWQLLRGDAVVASEATMAFNRARRDARSYCVAIHNIKSLTVFAAQLAVPS